MQIGSMSIGDVSHAVLVNGIKYYDSVCLTKYKDRETMTIGKSTTIELPDVAQEKNCKINFLETGTLSERIQDTRFWLSICSNEKCNLVCEDVFSADIEMKYGAEYIDRIKDRLKTLEDIKNVLDFFGVRDDLDIDALTEDEERYLDMLASASQGEELELKIEGDFNIAISTISVSNLRILRYVDALENGKYKVYNFFNMPKLSCGIRVAEEETEASPYILLRKQHFVESSNISYEAVYEAITFPPFVFPYSAAVLQLLLAAISAYDEKKLRDYCTL